MNRDEALRKPAGRDAQLISLPEGVVVNRDNKIRYPDPSQRQHMKLFRRKQMPKFEESLWTRSTFYSTAGNVSAETIQHYIKRQSRT